MGLEINNNSSFYNKGFIGSIKSKNLKDDLTYDDKKILRDSCLLCGIIVIIFGCIFLFAYMDDEDEWIEESYLRQRILFLGVILFITTVALCLYVMKTDKKEQMEELLLLVIDKPPSYESVILQEPPPAYMAVVRSIHIVQQETTG